MVYILTRTEPSPASPYLTTAEYRAAPTGVDITSLGRGDQAAALAELGNVITRASSWADIFCGQVLAATPDVEGGRLTISRDGTLRIHPRQAPIAEVTAISYGQTPASMTAMSDLSGVWVEPGAIVVPLQGVSGSFVQLGLSLPAPGRTLYAQWSYVAGWANTTLASPALAGDLTLTVANPTGVTPTSQVTIYDGAQTETVTVSNSYVPGTATLALTSALAFAHPQVGVSVSALPPAVKQAVILLTSALIKTRGSASIVMQSVRSEPGHKVRSETGGTEEVELAKSLLDPYRVVM